jgi:hypothetical protein
MLTPVWQCVMHTTQAGIALIIQAAVRQVASPQEAPHISITPVKDGVYAHERGPARTAWAEVLLTIRVWITPAVVT